MPFRRTFNRWLSLSLILASSSSLAAGSAKPVPEAADELLIVDCVLPGQLRQLGRRTTYLSARRAIRTTAVDCRVRGGEYVLRDQASLGAAIAVWQQQAEAGDIAAQVTLGEILEGGIAGMTDPALARRWYQRAAEQGSTRAMIALGNLFERGLGGAADSDTALLWYRRAAGLDDSVALEPGTAISPLDAKLRQQLKALKLEAQHLKDRQNELEALNETLAATLSERELDSTAQEQQRTDRATLNAQLDAQRLANAALQEQIDALSAARDDERLRNAGLTEALATARAESNATVVLLRDQLRQQETTSTAAQQELSASLDALRQREGALTAALQRIDELNTDLSTIRSVRSRQRASAAAEARDPSTTAAAALAAPEILLIEPQLDVGTRGLVKVSVPPKITASAGTWQQLVGRVMAPAGLLTLTANRQPLPVNPAGVFQLPLETPLPRELTLTAIDQRGARTDLVVRLDQPEPVTTSLPRVDLGRYHALLIANSNYAQMPQLKTPEADVEQVAELLRSRYGFSTEILRDLTRYELLSALNRYRERMTRRDNLLIYYAGHGELDRTNMRGHWLPIDAELTSTANWVSNTDVTDILNVMTANHVMLVVDSCYSGTLTRSAMIRLKAGMTREEETSWLELMASRRARVALSSGGLAPVLDYGGGRHSVFARAFIETLAANRGVLPGRSLHQAIAARVAHNAANLEFEQLPEYAPITRAGHEAGDFVLLPRAPR